MVNEIVNENEIEMLEEDVVKNNYLISKNPRLIWDFFVYSI